MAQGRRHRRTRSRPRAEQPRPAGRAKCIAGSGRRSTSPGVPHEQVRRGQELATPRLPRRRARCSRCGCSRPRTIGTPIKHRLPVRLHVGTAEVMATVSLLDCDTVEPGQWGLAQLFLDGAGHRGVGAAVRAARLVGRTHARRRAGRCSRSPRRCAAGTSKRSNTSRSSGPTTRETRALAVAWFAGFARLRADRPRARRGRRAGPRGRRWSHGSPRTGSWRNWRSRPTAGCSSTRTASRNWRRASSTRSLRCTPKAR